MVAVRELVTKYFSKLLHRLVSERAFLATKARRLYGTFKGVKMRGKLGFTLLQVSIMGTFLIAVACVFVPPLAVGAAGSKETSFLADLQTLRSQVELYKIHHAGKLPPTETLAAFTAAMTAKGPDKRGPYLQRIPANPFSGDSVIRFESGKSTAGARKAGWVLNTDTGILQADDSIRHARM